MREPRRHDTIALVLVLALGVSVDAQELGKANRLTDGVLAHVVALKKGRSVTKVWIYRPENAADQKVPCVLIAPAGTRLFHGMDLAEGDRPEHLPYVKAGFIVVAYEIDGALSDDPWDAEVIRALKRFKTALTGVRNARDALNFALKKVPAIDPRRIYAAGHSSAATLALVVAANDRRVKGCIAFAPCVDVPGRIGKETLAVFDQNVDGFSALIRRYSPDANVSRLRSALFLFHAEDDDNVPIAETVAFAERVRKSNKSVDLVKVKTGGHYDSMIKEGIPRAIAWIKSHEKPK